MFVPDHFELSALGTLVHMAAHNELDAGGRSFLRHQVTLGTGDVCAQLARAVQRDGGEERPSAESGLDAFESRCETVERDEASALEAFAQRRGWFGPGAASTWRSEM